MTNPKSADVLGQWLNGNQIYHARSSPPSFSPPKTTSLTLKNVSRWISDPHAMLKNWDSFSEQNFDEEQRINMIGRLVIVLWILLVLVGFLHETLGIIALIGAFFLILVLWYTIIPTTQGGIKSKRARYPVIIDDENKETP